MAEKAQVNQKAVELIHSGTAKFSVDPPFSEREGQIMKAFYRVAVALLESGERCKALEAELKTLKAGSVHE